MYAIILAAGKGSRMMSDLPKPLLPVAGKSMLLHVIDAAEPLISTSNMCIVYGHKGDVMQEHVKKDGLKWVEQSPQLGTGDAVRVATDVVIDDSPALILYGDVPLIQTKTLEKLKANFESNRAALTVLTAVLDNPAGYGRIVKGTDGKVVGVVEEKDASVEEKKIKEVNTGIMLVDGGCLRRWVYSLKNENTQKEYYLTDIVAMAASENYLVTTEVVACSNEVLGANDVEQLQELERLYVERVIA